MDSLILVNKPKGMTSHDVVDVVRKITGERRVGHAGTLDPNATGLLIVGVGREATKKLGDLTKNTKKTYEAEIILGANSTTDDSEGEITKQDDKRLSYEEIKKTLESFVGEQMQTPPAYSAIKLKGRKAYELARQGKTFELAPRKVIVYTLKLLDYNYPVLKIKCEVSSGTYIRALARDIGTELGTGAYLKELRRTKIGKYHIKDAVEINDIKP